MLNQPVQKPKNRIKALLALSLVHQLGVQRIRVLLQAVDQPAELFAMQADELEAVEGIGPARAKNIINFDDWDKVDRLLEKTHRAGAQIISFQDDKYPPLLREIYDPPILLWLKGDPDLLNRSGIAVVGTRRATKYGLKQAAVFSKKLAEEGLTIFSGLAYGVDAAAHKAALKADGTTIAVLGSGIDNIYPAKHAGLAKAITERNGAVISEFPPGTAPDAGNFPVRNRIITGLSLGTLVVESDLKGGSMISAQSALTQNREIFVIPHSLDNIRGTGCNHLIKRAAGKLVQTVDDILEELPVYQYVESESAVKAETDKAPHWKTLDLDESSRAICQLLEDKPRHIDDISEELKVVSHELLPKLLELEMQQCVRQTAGKNFELQ
jgi:DNA processing protein